MNSDIVNASTSLQWIFTCCNPLWKTKNKNINPNKNKLWFQFTGKQKERSILKIQTCCVSNKDKCCCRRGVYRESYSIMGDGLFVLWLKCSFNLFNLLLCLLLKAFLLKIGTLGKSKKWRYTIYLEANATNIPKLNLHSDPQLFNLFMYRQIAWVERS